MNFQNTAKTILLVASCFIASCAMQKAIYDSKAGDREKLSDESKSIIATAKPCCLSYDKIKFHKLGAKETYEVTLDSNSQFFEFPQGKSPFSAIELSGPKIRDSVSILSYHKCPPFSAYLWSCGIFLPMVVFLDEEFHEVRTFADIPYSYSNFTSFHLRAELKIPSNAKYMIAFMDSSLFGKNMAATIDGSFVAIGGTYTSTPTISEEIPYLYEGKIEISYK